jgi:hypothetical protein
VDAVAEDEAHDVEALPPLVEGAKRNVQVVKLIGDGAYDSSAVYGFLAGSGIEAVIKPSRNGRPDRGHQGRRRAVELVQSLGYDAWAGVTGYGRRWTVETAYSSFKRLFGEHNLARSMEGIAREIAGKVSLLMCW